jgi:hypothetical protein
MLQLKNSNFFYVCVFWNQSFYHTFNPGRSTIMGKKAKQNSPKIYKVNTLQLTSKQQQKNKNTKHDRISMLDHPCRMLQSCLLSLVHNSLSETHLFHILTRTSFSAFLLHELNMFFHNSAWVLQLSLPLHLFLDTSLFFFFAFHLPSR